MEQYLIRLKINLSNILLPFIFHPSFTPHDHGQTSTNKGYLALVKGDHFPSPHDQRGNYST